MSNDAPRICMLLESYYPVVGGMETQALNMCASFKNRGLPTLVVTRRPEKELADFEEVEGTPIYRCRPLGASSRKRWALVFSCLPTLFKLRKEYDIILVPGFRALGLSAVIMGKLLGKKSVLKAESSGELSGAFFDGGFKESKVPGGLAKCLIGLRNSILIKADAFTSLSDDQTTEFRACKVRDDQMHVIEQSVNVDKFFPVPDEKAALRKKLNLETNHRIAIYTGRLVSYKGGPVLLKAWKQLCEKYDDITLLMVGAGGVDIYNCENELRSFVKDSQLEKRVLFTGNVRNVDEYLKASDFYALPTENEAFPLALLEGMACGLPPVTTATGGIRDIVEHNVNGQVMENGNVDQCRDWITRFLEEPEFLKSMGDAAFNTVRTRYTLDIITDKYIALFKKLLP